MTSHRPSAAAGGKGRALPEQVLQPAEPHELDVDQDDDQAPDEPADVDVAGAGPGAA